MQIGKAKPLAAARIGSYIDWDDPTLLPFGLARLVKNCRYIEKSASCRYGLQRAFSAGSATRTLGLGILNFKGSPDLNTIVQYQSDGTMWHEQVEGSGNLAALTSALVPLPAGAFTQMSQAQNRLHIAFGDLKKGTARPAVFSNAAAPPPASTFFSLTRSAAAGTFAAARDVYVILTLTNGTVETLPSQSQLIVNTVLNDRIVVNIGVVPPDVIGFLTGVNVYEASVATGAAAPAQTAYKKVAGSPFVFSTVGPPGPTINSTANIDTDAAGAIPPSTNTADLNTLDPISYPSIGQAWEANRYYNAGTVLSPTVANGHLYLANTSGLSHATTEPRWPTVDSATVVDNAITWQEFTPNAGTVAQAPPIAYFTLSRVAGLGTFAAARDVYVVITIINGNGESTVSAAQTILNTVLNDRVHVVLGAMPSWYGGLVGAFVPTNWIVYEASVATGAAAPATSAYKKVAGGPFAFSASLNIDTDAGGAAPPAVNTATLGPVGNICAGQRSMVILQKNRNACINGMTNAAVVTFNVPVAGRQLWAGNIYRGPQNCEARVLAFTLAGDPTAGPYRYIGKNDSDPNLGVPIVATVISDNVTTGAYMQFTDEYLPTGGVEVTFFFTKIEVPPVSDIYYSKTLARMIYSGDPNNRSACWISLATDLESILQPNNLIEVATETKSDCICAREVGGVVLILKNDGGHIVQASQNDPQTWAVTAQWDSSGPSGPRAVDTFDSQDENAPGSFMVYWHQTGLYLYQGSKPVWVSEEMTNIAKRVNQAFRHLIWVTIDNVNREVRIGLPLDGAELPNKVLTVNYAEGWQRSYVFYPRSRGYIPVPGRKWSLDDVQAHSALVVQRNLSAPPDPGIGQQQLLFAAAAATGNGAVWMSVPNYYSDLLDGAAKTAIDQQYKTAYGPPKSSAIFECVGVECQGKGNGRAGVTVTGSQFNLTPKTGSPIGNYGCLDWIFEDSTTEQYYQQGFAEAENHGFSLELTNKNTADFFFELHSYTFFNQLRWRVRL